MVRYKQVSGRANDRPQYSVKSAFRVGLIVSLQDKVSVSRHQNRVTSTFPDKLIQGRQPRGRDFAPVGNRPKDLVQGLAQHNGGVKSLLSLARVRTGALSERVGLPRSKDPRFLREVDEIGILRQQLFRLVAGT